MSNWKIVANIATAFGVVFGVFAAFAAVLNYMYITIQYGNNVPASFLQVNILSAMLPFLLFTVLSFIVVMFAIRAEKAPVKNEEATEEQATETKPKEL